MADGVVFGKVSGAGAADYAETHEQPNVDAELAAAAKHWEEKFTEVTTRQGGRPVVEIRDALANAMWNKVGIFRNEQGITEALEEINTVKRSLRVGKGIGPRTCAPVRLAVSTISAVD